MKLSAQVLAFSLLLTFAPGCQPKDKSDTAPKKRPRPVEVQTLKLQSPPTSSLVSASVASWKTEEIGFEVGGRIEWVAEPNSDIEGRVIDEQVDEATGKKARVEIVKGTPVARIETERYELQLASAIAEVARAKQNIEAAEIERDAGIPSQLRAAEAEKTLAQTEYNRKKRLFEQNAGTKSDVERDAANLETAKANIQQLLASQKAKQAEIDSLRSQLLQAQQSQRDAERDLKDCTLYSSFRGQIADVAVVPGSVVSAGQPVATVQMMDPIKIELEVSAEESRRLRSRQRIPVFVTLRDGSVEPNEGFLYLVDPVADPQTRTYTLTLLFLNKKTTLAKPGEENIPTTDQLWRMNFSFLPGAEQGKTYVAAPAIHQDDNGHYLWRVENLNQHQPLPNDNKLKVSKLRVELGAAKLPFLGNWLFQEVNVLDDSFDPKLNLVAGKLELKNGNPDQWKGDTVLVDRSSQWMVRPGDLVKVDLSSTDIQPGYFVPMDAIAHDAGKNYLFVTESSGSATVVKRVEIKMADKSESPVTSSLRRVEPIGGSGSLEGMAYVTRGVHYLREGEAVKITSGTNQENPGAAP